MRVTISQLTKPQFSDRCVVCGADHPATTASLTGRDALAGGRLWQLFDGWYSVAVPCCRWCGWRLHGRRLARSLALVGGILGGGTLAALGSGGTISPRFALIGGGAILIFLIGLAVLERRSPLPFDFEPEGDDVSFDFRDLSLGYEFRALNAPAAKAGGLTSA